MTHEGVTNCAPLSWAAMKHNDQNWMCHTWEQHDHAARAARMCVVWGGEEDGVKEMRGFEQEAVPRMVPQHGGYANQ